MAKASILNLYVNTASFQKEYDWYQVDADGTIEALPDDPQIYEALQDQSLTRGRSLIFFTHGGNTGVYWGRDDLPPAKDGSPGDWMGRQLTYRAIIEFTNGEDAVEFYSGLLRSWWPHDAPLTSTLSEFVERVGAVAAKQHLSPEEQLHPAIATLLERWRSEPKEDLESQILLKEQPLLALESGERLQELDHYVRRDLPRSAVLSRAPESTQPLVVVARTLAPDRLQGVWRALTDFEDTSSAKADWITTGSPIAQPLPLLATANTTGGTPYPPPDKPSFDGTRVSETISDRANPAEFAPLNPQSDEVKNPVKEETPNLHDGPPRPKQTMWFFIGLSLTVVLLLIIAVWWMQHSPSGE